MMKHDKPEFVDAKHLVIESVIIDDKIVGMAAIAFNRYNVGMWSVNCDAKVDDNDIPPTSTDLVPWIKELKHTKDNQTKQDIVQLLCIGGESEQSAINGLSNFIERHQPDYCWSFDGSTYAYLRSMKVPEKSLGNIVVLPISVLIGSATEDNPLLDTLKIPMVPKTKAMLEFRILAGIFEDIETSERNPIITGLKNEVLQESMQKLLSVA
ncbi:hypothetical protein [Ralstonia phage RP13]|nr:hypothetical protein [Ralstonia phage RP13]